MGVLWKQFWRPAREKDRVDEEASGRHPVHRSELHVAHGAGVYSPARRVLTILVPLLIKDLVFSKALVLASIGGLDDNTQYYFLEAALVSIAGEQNHELYRKKIPPHSGGICFSRLTRCHLKDARAKTCPAFRDPCLTAGRPYNGTRLRELCWSGGREILTLSTNVIEIGSNDVYFWLGADRQGGHRTRSRPRVSGEL